MSVLNTRPLSHLLFDESYVQCGYDGKKVLKSSYNDLLHCLYFCTGYAAPVQN